MTGRVRDAVADEHQRSAYVPRRRDAHGLEMPTDFKLNVLILRTLKRQNRCGHQLGGWHGERLEIASVLGSGFETGLLKLVGDVLGSEVDAGGIDSASFALGRGQEVDVLSHAGLAVFVSRAR